MIGNVRRRFFRTHTCGDIRKHHVRESVVLSGWIESFRVFGPITFLNLRDRYGNTQIVLKPENVGPFQYDKILSLNKESVVTIKGKVDYRESKNVNSKMKTGEMEVICEAVEILNESEKLPIRISDKIEVSEELGLKHRHLELRKSSLQANLALRSKVAMKARNSLVDLGFLEIETPTLFKSTPEGAREFIVPTREPNAFYALTQSPQQYKQLLMVAGMDKYFQIARCYRDEKGRKDRQPEFTQIDMEASFVSKTQIMDMVENMVKDIWKLKGFEIPDFKTMDYLECMRLYGSDKPDLRYGLKIRDVTRYFFGDNTNEKVEFALNQGGGVFAIRAKELGVKNFSGKHLKLLQQEANRYAEGDTTIYIEKVDQETSKLSKVFNQESIQSTYESLNVQKGDVMIFGIGSNQMDICTQLGRIRQYCAKQLYNRGYLQNEFRSDHFQHLWVVHFPLFEMSKSNTITSTHHPFTAPTPASLPILQNYLSQPTCEYRKSQLLSIQAEHFDLVCNGWELGGGSMRIHDAKLQSSVLKQVLQLPPQQLESFDHLLQGLSQGCPPHGGMALGLDRLVGILCQADSLRQVIAFPKSAQGKELMTNSPSSVDESTLRSYFIQSIK